MMRPLAVWNDFRLVGWLAFFLFMILAGRDGAYLADTQRTILWLGTFLLLVVFVGAPVKRSGTIRLPWRHHLALLMETAGHWTPLLLAVAMGVTTLNLDVANLRNGIQMRVYDPTREPGTIGYDPSRLGPGEFFPVTLIDLYVHEVLEIQARVELVGRVAFMNDEDAQKRFPERGAEGVIVLYRFAIACCAADASPVAVVLEGIPKESVPVAGEWLRVQGITRPLPGEPRVLALRVLTMASIPQPQQPYLSWLDAM
ncbi:MAG: hypothetical protein HQL76_06980 [Magnetococcales bacterium]|nr:hypothetical protein [Magnetococcales bacterium]